MTTTASGLKYADRAGDGDAVKTGDMVVVNYTGWLDNWTLFDSSLNPGREPYQFKVGANQVIDGWDLGLPGMKIGGRRLLVIPPALGYGSQTKGLIPANSTLNFIVELLAINPKYSDPVAPWTLADGSTMTIYQYPYNSQTITAAYITDSYGETTTNLAGMLTGKTWAGDWWSGGEGQGTFSITFDANWYTFSGTFSGDYSGVLSAIRSYADNN